VHYKRLLSIEQTRRILQQVKWFRVVLDEGHKIKNPSSKQTQAINSLHSDRRWILTGKEQTQAINSLHSDRGWILTGKEQCILDNDSGFCFSSEL
jgi:hypothetical protein